MWRLKEPEFSKGPSFLNQVCVGGVLGSKVGRNQNLVFRGSSFNWGIPKQSIEHWKDESASKL